MSFGYKYGSPRDADLVIDVRFLPNPHWVDELRPLPGTDERVRTYVKGQQTYREFMRRLRSLLGFMVPGLRRRGEVLPDGRGRLHRRPPPLGRRRRGARARSSATRAFRSRSSTATSTARSRRIRPDDLAAPRWLGCWAPSPRGGTHGRQDRHQRLRPHRPQLLPGREAAGQGLGLRRRQRHHRRRDSRAPAQVRLGPRHASTAEVRRHRRTASSVDGDELQGPRRTRPGRDPVEGPRRRRRRSSPPACSPTARRPPSTSTAGAKKVVIIAPAKGEDVTICSA